MTELFLTIILNRGNKTITHFCFLTSQLNQKVKPGSSKGQLISNISLELYFAVFVATSNGQKQLNRFMQLGGSNKPR